MRQRRPVSGVGGYPGLAVSMQDGKVRRSVNGRRSIRTGSITDWGWIGLRVQHEDGKCVRDRSGLVIMEVYALAARRVGSPRRVTYVLRKAYVALGTPSADCSRMVVGEPGRGAEPRPIRHVPQLWGRGLFQVPETARGAAHRTAARRGRDPYAEATQPLAPARVPPLGSVACDPACARARAPDSVARTRARA